LREDIESLTREIHVQEIDDLQEAEPPQAQTEAEPEAQPDTKTTTDFTQEDQANHDDRADMQSPESLEGRTSDKVGGERRNGGFGSQYVYSSVDELKFFNGGTRVYEFGTPLHFQTRTQSSLSHSLDWQIHSEPSQRGYEAVVKTLELSLTKKIKMRTQCWRDAFSEIIRNPPQVLLSKLKSK
jgi:hypothetical protein